MSTTVDRPVTLDWASSNHWSHRQAACIHCAAPTHLRDPAARPSHKTCAERAVRAEQRRMYP